MRERVVRDFQAYGRPLDMVLSFKYLGWTLTTSDDNLTLVVGNLCKDWNIWARILRILGREGASPRVSGILFKLVAQIVLLFGSDTWMMTPCIGWALWWFQYRFS